VCAPYYEGGGRGLASMLHIDDAERLMVGCYMGCYVWCYIGCYMLNSPV